MIIPIRCFSCGKVIGNKYEEYTKMLEEGIDPKKALDDLGLDRYCCRRMILSHRNLIDEVMQFKV